LGLEEAIHGVGSGILHGGSDVGVDIHRRRDRAVAWRRLDSLHGDARFDEESRGSVAEIV
jgi:hypothetical protein